VGKPGGGGCNADQVKYPAISAMTAVTDLGGAVWLVG